MLRRLSTLIALGLATALSGAAAAQDAAPLPRAPVPAANLEPPSAVSAAAPLLPASTSPAQATRPAISPERLEAFVDGWMADAMNRNHVAGAAVSVVQNGQVALKKGYGFADQKTGRRVDPDRTLFRVASISKTFTWILLMKEVEAGRIRLDRPVNLYLPEKVRLHDDGMSRDVLVGDLMDHAGGFEDRLLGQLFERDPRSVRPLDLYLRQERPRRVYEPGRFSSYSNYGAALAGEAVAFVSGRTFESRVEDEIIRPLRMGHTTFREPRPERRGLPAPMPAGLRADLATGYRWTGAGFEPRAYEFAGQVAPAASASSTAGDMARYMLMMLGDGSLDGATIYGPRAARAFRTPLISMPRGLNGWAHGLTVYDLPGGYRGYGHDGGTVSFHSRLVVIPALNLGVFVTTSSDGGYDIIRRLVGQMLREFYVGPAPFPRRGVADLANQRRRYEGYYVNTRRAYGGLEGFVTLAAGGTTVSVTPDGRLITSDMNETRAWVPDGPAAAGRFIAVQGDATLVFGMSGDRAASLYDADSGAVSRRAPFWMRLDVLGFLAGLTGVAAAATLAGVAMRNRRDFRENPTQARAALVQNIQAGLWLTSAALFAAWASKVSDSAAVIFDWPGLSMIIASACALVAASLTLLTIAALPAVWRGGRRVDSWAPLRRAYFTVTVLIYSAFSVLLAMWGALAPWSG